MYLRFPLFTQWSFKEQKSINADGPMKGELKMNSKLKPYLKFDISHPYWRIKCSYVRVLSSIVSFSHSGIITCPALPGIKDQNLWRVFFLTSDQNRRNTMPCTHFGSFTVKDKNIVRSILCISLTDSKGRVDKSLIAGP